MVFSERSCYSNSSPNKVFPENSSTDKKDFSFEYLRRSVT